MRSTKREQGTLILMMAFGFAAGVCGAQAPAGTSASPAAATAPAADAQPAPAVVAPPPEAPVTPPKVVCAGGQISISANNSTLSSVLAEVHRCLGARIDIPGDAGAKRIYDKIGPGPASEVLDVLLSNTGYNYIIGASPDNEEKIESIVLLARTGDTAVAASVDDARAGSTSHRLFMQMHQNSIPHPMTDADSAAAAELGKPKETAPAAAANEAAAPAAPAPADGQQPPAAPAPDTKPADAAPAQPDTPATPASSNSTYTSKPQTTEEQIVNMQQMFELRRQLTQQQQQAAPPPQN
jgi:hypothetical protein